MDQSKIHESWKPLFDKFSSKLCEISNIMDKLSMPIYPPKHQVFRVFEMDVKEIRVLLLGQDPYHGPGQANGLAFSVNRDITIPASLQNIFKELKAEFPEREYSFTSGDISRWFIEEKIFLLNSALTVAQASPSCFMKQWEPFTNEVIKFVAENNNTCFFLLLGNFSKKKEIFNEDKKRIIFGVHPSPLSAHKGFFGSNIFKKVEDILGKEIDWRI